ncbi:MAG: serine protease [Kiritimatiellales bacterium]|nr:serine protease [Kiritimatiellales bacterium]MCF7864410.1 serine protease [Kiritimatiellales bacterium]
MIIASSTVFAKDSDDDAKAEREKEAVLEKKRAEEKVIKAQFGYSFNDIADKLVIIEHELGSGSGFLAKMDDKYYIITNQHVILGADQISFKTATGEQLRPIKVELSTTRDIVRLELATESGFALSESIEMGIPIGVFGNSDGGAVATELYGKTSGVGGDVIEVSADFVAGNSGSPVLNLDQQVIGIASYVKFSRKSKMKEGTKFENKTRRFCYRLTGTQWQTVDWKLYNKKYGKLYRANEQLVDSIFEIIGQWYENPFKKVTVENHPDQELCRWSDAHNLMVNRITRLSDKGRASPHELNNTNQQIRKDIGDSAGALSAVCTGRARQISLLASQRELTEFMRKEFESNASSLEYAAKAIDRFGDKLTDINFFRFKDDND